MTWTSRLAVLALAASGLASPMATAAEPSAEMASPEIALRLVAEAPGADGSLRAALLLDLAPGWKTYWLDPGDAGIPSEIDASASLNLEPLGTAFPVPHRVRDAYGSSNVFSQPLAVALAFRRIDPAAPARIDVAATLGVCREVCIPVDAHLSLAVAASDDAAARLVASAFSAVPTPSGPGAGIVSATATEGGKAIEVVAVAPSGEAARDADLFVAGPEGWFFAAPKPPRREGGRLVFEVPVAERPKAAGEAPPASIDAVLTLGASAYGASGLPVAPR